MKPSRARGFSILECMFALGLLSFLAAVAMDGGRATLRASRLTEDALRARLAATARLEAVSPAGLVVGTRRFDAGRADLSGEETVREVAPGLVEVHVEVRAASGARAMLVTRRARTEGP